MSHACLFSADVGLERIEGAPKMKFSRRHHWKAGLRGISIMFSSGDGPLKPFAALLPAKANGPSSIMARLNVTQRSGPPPSGAAGLRVAVAFYAMDGTMPSLRNMPSICIPKLDDVRTAMTPTR